VEEAEGEIWLRSVGSILFRVGLVEVVTMLLQRQSRILLVGGFKSFQDDKHTSPSLYAQKYTIIPTM
jgi:hypothetical protein